MNGSWLTIRERLGVVLRLVHRSLRLDHLLCQILGIGLTDLLDLGDLQLLKVLLATIALLLWNGNYLALALDLGLGGSLDLIF